MKNIKALAISLFILFIMLSSNINIVSSEEFNPQVGAPAFSYPNPTNTSTNVSVLTTKWNITIEDLLGNLTDWSLQAAFGINSSTNDVNGSKNITINIGNLSYGINYTIWVNATDGDDADNATYYFTTETPLNVTINGSTYVEETNATLLGYVTNNGSNDTTCWFQCKKESSDFTSPEVNQSVGVVAQGSTFSYNVALDNGTFYYYISKINNSYGWNYSWNMSYFMTKPQAPSGLTVREIPTGINLSWTHGNGYNKSSIWYNTTAMPQTRGVGCTLLYLGENNYYEHIDLTPGTTYYYKIWEYSEWMPLGLGEYSDGNTSSAHQYDGNLTIFSYPNPTNGSIGVSVETETWNITITSPTGPSFNWTIQSAVGGNSSNVASNGSKSIIIVGNLTTDVTYTIWVNATEPDCINWTNETFWFSTRTNLGPTFTYENPTNASTDVLANTTTWNVTIIDPDSPAFNWSIDTCPDVGNNSCDSDINGSKTCTLSGLVNDTTYTIYVNTTDGTNATNATYWFKTYTPQFTLVTTLTFGGQAIVQSEYPVITDYAPANGSTEIIMYPWLNLTILDYQGEHFNITWWTNATGAWVPFNTTCSNGTYRQRATWANESNTMYWWTVEINDSGGYWTNETYHFTTDTYTWGTWSDWWVFNYSVGVPTDFVAQAYNTTQINLTWTKGESADNTTILRNESGWSYYPLTPTNGTIVYNTSLSYYNDTLLPSGVTYYYTAWGWNVTEGNHSISNATAYDTTHSPPTIWGISPLNATGNLSKRPMCIIQANDSDGDALEICWYDNSTGAFVFRNINSSVTANSTLAYKFYQFNYHDTIYWWKVTVNDSETNVTAIFNFTTAPEVSPTLTGENPTNQSTGASTYTQLNITVYDANHDVVNATWLSNSSGSWVIFAYNGSIDTDNGSVNIIQTNVNFTTLNQTYYWSVNLTAYDNYTNETYHFTTTTINISTPYPVNQTGNVERPPTNISTYITGTNVDIYYYFWNCTPAVNTTSLFRNWSSQSTGRFEYDTSGAIPGGTDTRFAWGNTNYIWHANVTDGSTWVNRTYNYTTTGSRYDVTNSGDVVSGDVLTCWDNRAPATYYGIYDVVWSGDVTSTDVLEIWDNRD